MFVAANRVYYHTSIHKKNAYRNVYELDNEFQDEIIEKVIIPYLKDEKIHFDGYFIEPENVDRIVIKQSTISSKQFIKDENERSFKSRAAAMMSPSDIMNNDNYTRDITKIMFAIAEKKLEEQGHTEDKVSKDEVSKDESEIDRTKVFIVHGHDDLAKTQVSELIRRLGLIPVILHQQANEGKTIIEKIESYSNVGFGVVLYTPCDVGSKEGDEKNLKPRARQNVVFEHGFLIGKIGRANVAALVKDTVETPNDISGVVYITMKSEGDWELQLARELKSSGYDIDLNKLYN
ncbi:TIR domain-containing protein [Bacillus sp. RIT 809]|uniref:TIR domain-containing protein n=1 Tax=Bacillus sp. RIT 809 TaxID=2803857 RepID=UPI00195203EF|nr:nucleotide-binding protein [Bacillus sp. RIT 809]MBM6649615.1 nucleotide-binding protein [Bacillus sp. RIT 809]